MKVAAKELIERNWESDELAARVDWLDRAVRVSCFKTPDETLNRMLVKGMLGRI